MEQRVDAFGADGITRETFEAFFEGDGAIRTADGKTLDRTKRTAMFEALQDKGSLSFTADDGGSFTISRKPIIPDKKDGPAEPIVERSRKERLGLRARLVLGDMAIGVQHRSGYTAAKNLHRRYTDHTANKATAEQAAKLKATADAARNQWENTRRTRLKLEYEPVELERYNAQFNPSAAIVAEQAAYRERQQRLRQQEQDLRERELAQRERVLQLRDEALARGEIINIPSPGTGDRRGQSREDAAMQNYERRKAYWDEQTAIIDSFKAQSEYADLFDDEKLRELDRDIQDKAAPKLNAKLSSRIEKANESLPEDEKLKLPAEMTADEREQALKKFLSGAERAAIVNPIDNEDTRLYMGDKLADNRELMLAISWHRRRLTNRTAEPKPPRTTPTS